MRPLPSRSLTVPSDRRADPPGSVLSEAPSAPTGLLRDILASHPSAVVLVDSSGRIVFANPHTSELTGYAEDELNGIPVDKLVPEQLRRGHRQNRESYLAAPETRPMALGRDLHVRHKDGRLVPVEIGLSSFASEGRRYVVAVLADPPARKRREKALGRPSPDREALPPPPPPATIGPALAAIAGLGGPGT